MNQPQLLSAEETANAIKHMVIGSIIAEYGLMLLGTQSHDLKHRTQIALNACRSVQSCLIHHPRARPEHRELFKREFLKSSYVLISELLVSVWSLSEEDIEDIIEQIKNNTDQTAIE
jgi:hypothetical protein